jgi:hypothetical protein
MAADVDAVTQAFVESLASLLLTEREGKVTIEQRSKLAAARAHAKKVLNATQYDEAVFRAFRIAGYDFE